VHALYSNMLALLLPITTIKSVATYFESMAVTLDIFLRGRINFECVNIDEDSNQPPQSAELQLGADKGYSTS